MCKQAAALHCARELGVTPEGINIYLEAGPQLAKASDGYHVASILQQYGITSEQGAYYGFKTFEEMVEAARTYPSGTVYFIQGPHHCVAATLETIDGELALVWREAGWGRATTPADIRWLEDLQLARSQHTREEMERGAGPYLWNFWAMTKK